MLKFLRDWQEIRRIRRDFKRKGIDAKVSRMWGSIVVTVMGGA